MRNTTYTRHKEYSLAIAALAATGLLFLGGTTNFPLLFLLNAFSILSILYSAFSVVRHADVLAHRFGEPYGSLILSLAIVVLEASLICVLMLTDAAGVTLMRDTIYSVIMFVMTGFTGLALLLGGYKYKTQNFNLIGIKHFLISIIPLSVIVLALPTALGTGRLTSGQLLVEALACLVIYAVFLWIQTVTHKNFFVYENEDEDKEHHGKASAHSTAWHGVFLVVHLIAVIAVTKLNTNPLHQTLDFFNAPPAFSGFLVALLILSPEGTGAFRAILQNQVQRAMNLLLGSVLATISLTVPLVVLAALLTGKQLQLGLDYADIALLITTFMVCQTSLTTGETNAHSGTAHIILFMIYLMLIFQ